MTPVGKTIQDFDTNDLLGKIFLFFEAQESGYLRKSHRVKWRGNSYVKDGHAEGLDLVGGWQDAGVLQVAWAMRAGEDILKSGTFQDQANWDWGLQTLLHGIDFLFKCCIKPGVMVAQVGNVQQDHCQCLRAERDESTPREVVLVTPERPGADLLSSAASAFAAAHLVLRTAGRSELADRCLQQALELYQSAKQHPGIYSDSNPVLAETYKNDNWQQFMFLAAAWLFVATEDEKYHTVCTLHAWRVAASPELVRLFEDMEAQEWEKASQDKQWWPDYSWGQVYFGATALLWETTLLPQYAHKLEYFATSHLEQKNNIKRTPCGLTFVTKWGSCRHAAGAAAILAAYACGLVKQDAGSPRAAEVAAFAREQILYIMGAYNHSWVIGFGVNPPCRPHHRDSALHMRESGNWEAFNRDQANPNELVGGLCGGPLEDGTWKDDRADYVGNEVALDYNAALLIGTVHTLRTVLC